MSFANWGSYQDHGSGDGILVFFLLNYHFAHMYIITSVYKPVSDCILFWSSPLKSEKRLKKIKVMSYFSKKK